jgi:amino acid transporter
MQAGKLSVRKLKLFQLAAVIFFTVSGGPYGLEPLLIYAGKNASLILLLLTPLVWDIPTIFTVLELNSMMPVTGGYYQWVKRALGMRMALYEGWWTWLYTFVDLAIYPVLFVEYASFFYPPLRDYKIPVCLCIIWGGAALNIIGIVPVGRVSVLLGFIVIIPFLILFISAIVKHHGVYHLPPVSFKGMTFSSFGMALYTIMWNFLGWDSTTTYAEEVENPVRTYLYSAGLAFVLVILIYGSVILTSVQSGMGLADINEHLFPSLGEFIGGHWLGALLAFGGMASTLGLYMAVLLSISRVPKAMADDGLLPQKLNKLHPRFGTPYISILICSIVVSIMVTFTFGDLLIMDVTLYGAGLLLEFVSLIVLRVKFPDEHRPFKIPLNVAGLCVMTLLPVAVYALAVAGAFSKAGTTLMPLILAIGMLFTGEILWRIYVWNKARTDNKSSNGLNM